MRAAPLLTESIAVAMCVKRCCTSGEKSMSVNRDAIVESTETESVLVIQPDHSLSLTREYASKLSSPRQRSIRLMSPDPPTQPDTPDTPTLRHPDTVDTVDTIPPLAEFFRNIVAAIFGDIWRYYRYLAILTDT